MTETIIITVVGIALLIYGLRGRPPFAAIGGGMTVLGFVSLFPKFGAVTRITLIQAWHSFYIWAVTAFSGQPKANTWAILVAIGAAIAMIFAYRWKKTVFGMLAAVLLFALLSAIFPHFAHASLHLAEAWLKQIGHWLTHAFRGSGL